MSHDRIADIERDVARGFAARPQEILASLNKLPCHFCGVIGDGVHKEGCPVLLAKETMEQYRGEVKTTTGNVPAEGANPAVDHPAHYNQHPSGVECIDIVRWMGFNLGNVVKYLWRDGLKDTEVELQDLEKAAWYLNNEIQRRKNDPPVYADTIIYGGTDNDNSTAE